MSPTVSKAVAPRRSLRQRVARLAAILAGAAIVTVLTLNVGLAWLLVETMTHPPCREPVPLAGQPAPEEHWLPTADGHQIRVWYYPSRNGAVVLTFGGMDGALGDRLPPVAFLLAAGYGVVQVDTRACARPPAPVTQGYNELYDGEAALDFALARPEVEADRVGALGFSMGGATALRLAAQRAEVRAVVRDGGFACLGRLLSPAAGDGWATRVHKDTILLLYRWRAHIDPWAVCPVDDLAAIAPRPVLLIYGEHEVACGLAQVREAGDHVQLWLVPGGDHGRNHIVAPAAFRQRVLAFFGEAFWGR